MTHSDLYLGELNHTPLDDLRLVISDLGLVAVEWADSQPELDRLLHRLARPVIDDSVRAYRAIGRANATNPMPLVIPCHRVIGADGKLHGYGGGQGLPTKAWLLQLEGAVPAVDP